MNVVFPDVLKCLIMEALELNEEEVIANFFVYYMVKCGN